MFYQTIDFDNSNTGTASFAAKPVVTVTPALLSTTVTPPTNRNSGLICTVIGISETGFTVRVIKAKELTEDLPSTVLDPKPVQFFDINWIAIGPK